MWWRSYDSMLNRFHRIPERNEQTDGQTDRRTVRIAIYLFIYLKSRDQGDVSAETQQGRLTMWIKSVIVYKCLKLTFKSSRRRNATKRWWKFVPCTWTSSREGPVSGRRCSSWHCNWTGCVRSEARSDSCNGRRRDQVRQVRWCVAVQAAMYHHTQLVLDKLCMINIAR